MVKNIKKFSIVSALYFILCVFYADATVQLRSHAAMKWSLVPQHHESRTSIRFTRQDKENLR